MNRKQRRIQASQLRGSKTTTSITLDPNIPKDLNIPIGYKFSGVGGVLVKTTKAYYVKKRWYWKLFKKFNKDYRPSLKVEVVFI